MRGSSIQMQGFALDRNLESKSVVTEDQAKYMDKRADRSEDMVAA